MENYLKPVDSLVHLIGINHFHVEVHLFYCYFSGLKKHLTFETIHGMRYAVSFSSVLC